MVANVWKVVASVGDTVNAGDTLVILESMKMEIPVLAGEAGTVQDLRDKEGDAVREGDIIALIDVLDLHRRWFDRWLKDVPEPPLPARSRLFLTGENAWRDAKTWPPPDLTPTPLYLRSGGAANTLAGDGRLATSAPVEPEPADVFTYDPSDPVPAVIDENYYAADRVQTPLDRRFQHRRDDVLVYTGPQVTEALVLAGMPTVHLFAATDGPDTDWFVALHDISPTGKSMQLATGRLRGRFRESLEREVLLESDRVYEFVVELSAVGHVVLPGHALRLTVTSSDFPTWDRNLNTGGPIGTGTNMRVAKNRVLHGPAAASCVVLPVASASSLTAAC